MASDVGLELPQDDADVALRGQVGDDLELEDLDVGRVGAADEERPEERLEHVVPRLRRRHRGDAVQHDRLDFAVRAEEPDQGLGHHLKAGSNKGQFLGHQNSKEGQ